MRRQKKTQRQVLIEGQTTISKVPTWRIRGQKRAREIIGAEDQGSSKKRGTDANEDRDIMLKLEDEFERRLRHKVLQCKSSNGDMDTLLQKESNTDRLESGVVTSAEKAAAYPATKIEKYFKRLNRKESIKSFERWNKYVTNNFHRIVSEMEAGDEIEYSNLHSEPEDLGSNVLIEQETVRTFNASFNAILRSDLPEDIRDHVTETLDNTTEEVSNYIIEYSIQFRKIMLSFSDSTFAIKEDGKVSLVKKGGFQLAGILPEDFEIQGETQFVPPLPSRSNCPIFYST